MQPATGFGAIRSLDDVILLCDDLQSMEHFYRDLFGFAVEDRTAGSWVGFQVGALFIGLRPRGRAYDG